MLKINYTPTIYVFTCNIPSEIEISSDAASVYVTIACGPDTIFETTLYPYNNIAMLYDARSIIEGHMLDKQRVFANFVITAVTKTEETTYAINTHHHPPQNPIQSRTHRHPPMDSQR